MVDLATKADSVSTRRAGCTCDNEPIPIVGEVRRVLETGCDDGKLHASAGVPRSIVGSTIKIASLGVRRLAIARAFQHSIISFVSTHRDKSSCGINTPPK
jgi:hypothetical protein